MDWDRKSSLGVSRWKMLVLTLAFVALVLGVGDVCSYMLPKTYKHQVTPVVVPQLGFVPARAAYQHFTVTGDAVELFDGALHSQSRANNMLELAGIETNDQWNRRVHEEQKKIWDKKNLFYKEREENGKRIQETYRYVNGKYLLASSNPIEPVGGEEEPASRQFIKVTKDALMTSIVTYASKKGDIKVDLVSAVHFGETSYYRFLNKQFKTYDAVLYELVAPPNSVPQKSTSMLAMVAKALLDLDSQIQRVNYKARNFIHADLDWNGMKEAIKKRGDTELSFGLRVIADVIKKSNTAEAGTDQAAIAVALANAKNPTDLKRALAMQFKSVKGLGLPTVDEVIVSDRNKAAIDVFKKQVENGKRNMAIFYGAAHMEDMASRLQKLGYTRTAEQWIVAWDLKDEED